MATELTPCGALFETMKRYGGISHKDLARLLLSGRPLADGKSPLSRCDDRTWVSRFIVHAPVGSLQDRYFCDWGVAALRVSARLRSRDGKGLSAEEALSLVTNQGGALMEQALRECHQDLALPQRAGAPSARCGLQRGGALRAGHGAVRGGGVQREREACVRLRARLREDGAWRKAGNRPRRRYGLRAA